MKHRAPSYYDLLVAYCRVLQRSSVAVSRAKP